MAKIKDIKAAAQRIEEKLAGLRALKGWSGVLGFFPAAYEVVREVEAEAALLGIKGGDKKRMAVDLILDIVPDSWLHDDLLRPIAGWAVERAVTYLNKKLNP